MPDSVLKAALLRRATEDINRVMVLRSQKQALAMLLQRGSVGDDLWQRFLRAEKEMEDEVRDVVAEVSLIWAPLIQDNLYSWIKANAYSPNWGQTIFQSANESMNNNLLRERLEAQQAKLSEERAWWDRKKSSIQEGFMKELDSTDSQGTTTKTAPVNTTSTPANSTPSDVKTPDSSGATSTTGSDDDAVLVEAEAAGQSGNANSTPGGSGGGGSSKKKKKGKK